ncbi:MAG: hypothetical protein F4103_06405 [Boseongicola sp. SB0673_bin_14]|nr:hypothetical protein [Boseongicola sp. SB0667_bin_21]MYI68379.1 hypothetical protein [Boseongicola sp. SB0673_bin_14]
MKWAKANWVTLVNVALGAVNLGLLYVLLFPTMIQLDMWRGLSVYNAYHRDALQVAVSVGRLDAVSILLTALGVILGLFAIVSFSYFKYGAEKAARDEAREIATKAANDAKILADKVARETAKEVAARVAQGRARPGPTVSATVKSVSPSEVKEVQDAKDIHVQGSESEDEKGGGNDDDDG